MKTDDELIEELRLFNHHDAAARYATLKSCFRGREFMLTKLEAIDWAYGNLACSTNHKPSRPAFKKVAMGAGISEEEFEEWAKDKKWREDDG